MQRIFYIISLLLLFTSCVQDPDGKLKKSANSKFFDTKGFHGQKRRPYLNSKYITKAKKNIKNNNLDVENEEELEDEADSDEIENPAAYHRDMYKRMLEREQKKSLRQKSRKSNYPKLSNSQSKLQDNAKTSHERKVLKKEIAEMKDLLKEVKDELEEINEQQNSKKPQNIIMPSQKSKVKPQKKSSHQPEQPIEGEAVSENISAKYLNDKFENNAVKARPIWHSAQLLNESFDTNDDVDPRQELEQEMDKARDSNKDNHWLF